jgi:prepilin-type N-terminal cleavage/methylation domain-containing protein/prepilin-type processing-associated H-X9-DG protein
MRPQRVSPHSGLTLIELLAVTAIIAILIGLIVPAIQMAREAAARVSCQNNLKQMALACSNYEATNNMLPPGASNEKANASMQVLILPYLGQDSVYNLFDFTILINNAPDGSTNAIARTQEIKTYLCPSDPEAGRQPTIPVNGGRSNYFGNIGTTADFNSTDPLHVGVFNFTPYALNAPVPNPVRVTDIKDGTSNTAMISETKRATNCNAGKYDPTAVHTILVTDPGWNVLTPQYGPTVYEADDETALIQGQTYHCNVFDSASRLIAYRGCQYYRGLPEVSMYTHTVPPNYSGYDCGDRTKFTMAHVAARSYHRGGVNVCFVDGSVHFIADSVVFSVWQALGTSRAGDIVNPGAF